MVAYQPQLVLIDLLTSVTEFYDCQGTRPFLKLSAI